jgi:hypothetical protein
VRVISVVVEQEKPSVLAKNELLRQRLEALKSESASAAAETDTKKAAVISGNLKDEVIFMV